MRLSNLLWIVALFIVLCAGSTRQHPRMIGKREELNHSKPELEDVSPELEQLKHLNAQAKIDDGFQNSLPCDAMPQPCETSTTMPPEANRKVDCDQLQPSLLQHSQQYQQQQYQQLQQQAMQQQSLPQQQMQQQCIPVALAEMDDSEVRGKELRKLVQHLYVAQARVQLEATEIHKAQAVATSAQSQLEDSANHVRTITATLHNAQQEVAASAIRAQIAQLQLAAHDQLLFAARQDVDSLSSQVVGLQAAEGIVQPKLTVDLHALLDKLRQPLQHFDRPTPVPMIITLPPLNEAPPETAAVGVSVIAGHDTIVSKQEQSPSKRIVKRKKRIAASNKDYT